MSRDRLAAARAQRRQEEGGQALEMSHLRTEPLNNGNETAESSVFFSEISSIQEGVERIRINITRISTLHDRTMNAADRGSGQEIAQLDQLTRETRTLSHELKGKIKELEKVPPGHDVHIRRNRILFVRSKFLEAIRDYQKVEQEFQSKSRQRVERQFKIVKPDASPDEIAAVVDGGGEQIFAQALLTSSRYGESRLAYKEVQQRQQDIQKLEQTLTELALLFVDMGDLVDQQEETVQNVENIARDVEGDTEKAVEHTKKAIVHARSYRKGRWICFFVFLIAVAILAIVLGVVFGRK